MAKDRAGIDAQVNQRFAREVKARVNAYFEENGLSRHANAAMVAKTVTLVTLYFGAYALIIGGSLSWPWLWFLCLAMGAAWPASASRSPTTPYTARMPAAPEPTG
jgi:linoleoyl-CoA desaturase